MPTETTARPQGRSREANGAILPTGISGRSRSGKRLRDLARSFAAPLGGWDALDEIERGLIREASVLSIAIEETQRKIARCESIDDGDAARLAVAHREALLAVRDLARERRAAP